jgi:hypothetical protein
MSSGETSSSNVAAIQRETQTLDKMTTKAKRPVNKRETTTLCRLPGWSAAGSFRNSQPTRLESVCVFAKHRSDASGDWSTRLRRDSERGAPGRVRAPLGAPSSSLGRWTSRGPRSIAHGAGRRERSAASAAHCGGPWHDATGLSPARARPPRPARTPRARVAASHPARAARDRPSLAS